MQFAMNALTEAFTIQSGIECAMVLSSSGKLTAQIKEGAPYDVFVAANQKYPQAVYENGQAVHPPKVYAYGKLVLWTMQDELKLAIENLPQTQIQHIALANPKTAPYGEAAIQVLEHYQLLDSVQDKLVYGESIAQTNQFILSKAADVGFTAMSVVKAPNMRERGQWITLDENIYTPIEQAVVVLNNKADTTKAMQFYHFLFSAKAQQILKDFGYSVKLMSE